jgi:hypothetical protein
MSKGSTGVPPQFEEEAWMPPVELVWYQRWLRGWRLVVVIIALGSLYGAIRGLKDYRHIKAWRARGLAAEALKFTAPEDLSKAVALLEKAGTLSPNDPVVLRSLADFNEPRQDLMALYALRKLVNNGDATPQDRERLCLLAFDWGQPELAPTDMLAEWAATPAENLSLRPLELSARWLAMRGQAPEAERRLKSALEQAGNSPAADGIELALCRLLLTSGIAQQGNAAFLQEISTRLQQLVSRTVPPSLVRADAIRLLTSMLAHRAWSTLLPTNLDQFVQKSLVEQAAATKDGATILKYRLLDMGISINRLPARRTALADRLMEEMMGAPLPQKLVVARWLVEQQLFERALDFIRTNPDYLKDRNWFTVELDALFGLRQWEVLKERLTMSDSPLPAVVIALFKYRVAQAQQAPSETLEPLLANITTAAQQAEYSDALYVAGNLEKTREVTTALKLYERLQNHAQAGLTARLGAIRCLDGQLEKSGELIQALDALLRLWPSSDEARSDLAYLRLLDKNARREDREAIQELAKNSPQYLAYRIPAALIHLQENQPQEALQLLESSDVNWREVRAGWRAVYAAVLAANQKTQAAQEVLAQVTSAQLRPGERKLLEDAELKIP